MNERDRERERGATTASMCRDIESLGKVLSLSLTVCIREQQIPGLCLIISADWGKETCYISSAAS